MKQIRILVIVSAFALASLGGAMAQSQKAGANDSIVGTFLTTITDASTGAFSSRSVITLHADHSISIVDSTQGGPTFNFGDQQGVWEDHQGVRVARTINFRFPDAGIARSDYTFDSGTPNGQVKGTITLTIFAITDDPLDGGGIVIGTFNFIGQQMKAQ